LKKKKKKKLQAKHKSYLKQNYYSLQWHNSEWEYNWCRQSSDVSKAINTLMLSFSAQQQKILAAVFNLFTMLKTFSADK